jgi:hypothetical protein
VIFSLIFLWFFPWYYCVFSPYIYFWYCFRNPSTSSFTMPKPSTSICF